MKNRTGSALTKAWFTPGSALQDSRDHAVAMVVIEVVAEPLGLVEEAQVLVARHGGVGERKHDLAESGFPPSDRSSIDELMVIHGGLIHRRILALGGTEPSAPV